MIGLMHLPSWLACALMLALLAPSAGTAEVPGTRLAEAAGIEAPSTVDPGDNVVVRLSPARSGGRLEIWGPVTGPVGNINPGARLDSIEAAGGSVSINAPTQPGSYQLRYVAASGATLARRELEVAAVPVTLSVPQEMAAGLDTRIVWQGPADPRDMLRIVDPASSAVLSQAPADGTPGARNETMLRAPERLGDYRLQYWSGARQSVLRSLPVTVVRGNAWLRTPVQVYAGAQFSVEWRGPPSDNNAFQLVDPATDTVLTSQTGGATATLKAPTRTGKYRLRYVNTETGHIFSDLPLQVVAR